MACLAYFLPDLDTVSRLALATHRVVHHHLQPCASGRSVSPRRCVHGTRRAVQHPCRKAQFIDGQRQHVDSQDASKSDGRVEVSVFLASYSIVTGQFFCFFASVPSCVHTAAVFSAWSGIRAASCTFCQRLVQRMHPRSVRDSGIRSQQ